MWRRELTTWIDARAEHSVPPTVLATMVMSLSLQPLRILPLATVVPGLLYSSLLSLHGGQKKTNAAAISSAWSGIYGIMAMRRHQVRGLRSG